MQSSMPQSLASKMSQGDRANDSRQCTSAATMNNRSASTSAPPTTPTTATQPAPITLASALSMTTATSLPLPLPNGSVQGQSSYTSSIPASRSFHLLRILDEALDLTRLSAIDDDANDSNSESTTAAIRHQFFRDMSELDDSEDSLWRGWQPPRAQQPPPRQ